MSIVTTIAFRVQLEISTRRKFAGAKNREGGNWWSTNRKYRSAAVDDTTLRVLDGIAWGRVRSRTSRDDMDNDCRRMICTAVIQRPCSRDDSRNHGLLLKQDRNEWTFSGLSVSLSPLIAGQ